MKTTTVNEHVWFPTIGYSGHIDIAPETMRDFNKWLEIEKQITESSAPGTTTRNGYQRTLSNDDPVYKWYQDIFTQLGPAREAVLPANLRAVWVVDYEKGGYQEPHIHKASACTLVLNLSGTGELLLHDPRPMAVALVQQWGDVVTLNPGDWVVFPGWLTHSSRPSEDKRTILVMDFVTHGY